MGRSLKSCYICVTNMSELFMKQLIIFIILLLCSIPGFSQSDKEKRDPNLNDEKYLFLISKLDGISEPNEFVNTVWYIYINRDGGIGVEISPYIAKSIILYPNLIFKKFRDNPDSFNNWVERIAPDLFTDYNNGKESASLLKLKNDLLQTLNNYKQNAELDGFIPIIEKLIAEIDSTEINTIK